MSWFFVFFKGAAMGAANVIPGVSGGTVAFITGIYERLINALRALGGPALRALIRGDWRGFVRESDLVFLAFLGAGVVVSILTLAKALDYLFTRHETLVWAFFFGLILASIWFVGKKVKRWGVGTVLAFVAGGGAAIGVSLMHPASENDNFFYLMLCGVVSMASMIVPGLSGSFVLLLMGNYRLIMIEAVSQLTEGSLDAFRILVPVGLGAVAGLIALSHLLAWIFRRFHDTAVALMTGFVAGSLLTIWPWKAATIETFVRDGETKDKVIGYTWHWPAWEMATLVALGVMIAGALLVWMMERAGVEDLDRSRGGGSA